MISMVVVARILCQFFFYNDVSTNITPQHQQKCIEDKYLKTQQ